MNGETGPAANPQRRRARTRSEELTGEPAALRDRISRRTAARTRRAVTFVLGLWCGGMLLMALLAPASLRTVDSVIRLAPPAVATVIQATTPETTRGALRYQVGEVNRTLFAIWGRMQMGAALAVLLLLVFLSNANRATVGVAGLMTLLAALMNFVLTPRIATLTRTPAAVPGDAAGSFAFLHTSFAVFQLAVLVLIGVLFFLLFRGRRTGESGT
ncbi:MAG: hypothetical protein KJZ84_14815 [Bryobacteraceae bacterium]|nr:hypothetical protein [Bryobacteraceae bacterium]